MENKESSLHPSHLLCASLLLSQHPIRKYQHLYESLAKQINQPYHYVAFQDQNLLDAIFLKKNFLCFWTKIEKEITRFISYATSLIGFYLFITPRSQDQFLLAQRFCKFIPGLYNLNTSFPLLFRCFK